jgi:hypothetical protein
VNLGLPIGRPFQVEPTSRNAAWPLYFYYAFDDAFASDILKPRNQRQKNDLEAAT